MPDISYGHSLFVIAGFFGKAEAAWASLLIQGNPKTRGTLVSLYKLTCEHLARHIHCLLKSYFGVLGCTICCLWIPGSHMLVYYCWGYVWMLGFIHTGQKWIGISCVCLNTTLHEKICIQIWNGDFYCQLFESWPHIAALGQWECDPVSSPLGW